MSKLIFSKGVPLRNRFGALLDATETVMQQRVQWAQLILPALGKPVDAFNLISWVAWETAEGGGFGDIAAYNPLNDTQVEPGSVGVVNTGGDIYVQAYVSEEQGIQATVTTLTNGLYSTILNALAISTAPATVAGIIGGSPWGTNGTLIAECVAESQSAVIAYWTPPPPPSAGDTMFISYQGKTWMFVANGLASFWRQVPVPPTQYPIEPDPNGTWFGLWDHEANGKLVSP